MYAIFVDGGRQYRVEAGQTLDIDFREGTQAGDSLKFEKVLAIGSDEGLKLGTPAVSGGQRDCQGCRRRER